MLHHDDNKYDDKNTLANTIEVCQVCHNKLTAELGDYKQNLNRMCVACERKESDKTEWRNDNGIYICKRCFSYHVRPVKRRYNKF